MQSPTYYRLQQFLAVLRTLDLTVLRPKLAEVEIRARIGADSTPLRLLIRL